MAFQHALLQAVRHRDVTDPTVEGEHASMTAEPVAALHVLGRSREQQLAEAERGDEHPRLVDLAALHLQPLDRVAGVIDLHTFTGHELARRDTRHSVLRELAVELLPKVRVRGQVLGLFLPQELQRMPQPQIVDDRRPVELQHPQRIGQRLRCIGRDPQPVAHLPHRVARTTERPGNLA